MFYNFKTRERFSGFYYNIIPCTGLTVYIIRHLYEVDLIQTAAAGSAPPTARPQKQFVIIKYVIILL